MYAIYRRRLGMTPEILEADVSQQNLKFREQYWIDEGDNIMHFKVGMKVRRKPSRHDKWWLLSCSGAHVKPGQVFLVVSRDSYNNLYLKCPLGKYIFPDWDNMELVSYKDEEIFNDV